MQIEELRKELGYKWTPDNGNFYALKRIKKTPDKIAIKFPNFEDGVINYEVLTFGQFHIEALKIANGLNLAGYKKGDRVILLFPISINLYLTMFACFYLGIVPVFIDSTMGMKKIYYGIMDSKAKAIISVDKLLKFKFLFPVLWFKHCYSLDQERFFLRPFKNLIKKIPYSEPEEKLNPNSAALITFTSGSTGRPKGANRTIDILLNQKIISEYNWPHKEDEIDMPVFPMITLQNLGCGVTSILPAINFQDHKSMDPSMIVGQLNDEKITRFSAQPFFMEKLCDYIIKNKIMIDSVRSIVIGGAVVSKKLCKKIIFAFPNAEANIVYGSTEAEPISHTNVNDFISSDNKGILVGTIVKTLNVKILKSSINPNVDKDIVEKGIGEIILSGPHVINEYIDKHPANKILKLRDQNGVTWHRTGDMGYFDINDKLWIVGRIKDQIETSVGFVPCYDLEEELLELSGVKRAAFINMGSTLFIESETNKRIDRNEILKFLVVNNLSNFQVKYIDSIPVDKRHFSRVDRELLRTRQ